MRKLALLIWLMLPIVALAYHQGPGQRRMTLDRVSHLLHEAESHAASQQWDQAEKFYEQALSQLPADRVQVARRIRLERAKAQMFVRKLPVAHQELKALVDEMKEDQATDSQLFDDARGALANSQYYMTWLMRLEGQTREDWEPEIESARQLYRLLAENSAAENDVKAAQRYREDLEATIRLARMDLSDLQGLPLPSQ